MKKIFCTLIIIGILITEVSLHQIDSNNLKKKSYKNKNLLEKQLIIKLEDFGKPLKEECYPSDESLCSAMKIQARYHNEITKIKGVEGTGCILLKDGRIVIIVTTNLNFKNSDKNKIPLQLEGIPTFIYESTFPVVQFFWIDPGCSLKK